MMTGELKVGGPIPCYLYTWVVADIITTIRMEALLLKLILFTLEVGN